MLVAPLNWGLGHATRCIPIIHSLLEQGFEPIIASDGDALILLQKEFPSLKSYKLPTYNIKYAKSNKLLKLKLLLSVPSVLLAIKKEQKLISNLVEKEHLNGIISDNRFGVYSKKIPSVYITHQLNVLSGLTTKLTSRIHQKVIKKFDECWVPDFENEPNLSGNLGHVKHQNLSLKYLGVLSRFTYKKEEKKYDLMVLLSGPEPQRGILEKKLLKELQNFKGAVLMVRGVISKTKILKSTSTIEIKNYLLSKDLEKAINQSDLIIARSGYSTIMDLAILRKKAFFIPTPGQNEQEYLAQYLSEKKIIPFKAQDKFQLGSLNEMENFTGFSIKKTSIDLDFFSLF